MRTRALLKAFATIIILSLNLIAISCFSFNLDFELDITKNILNSENVIIDFSKKININNYNYIKIISYEEKEFELYSSHNPNKKLNPGDFIPIQEQLIIKVPSSTKYLRNEQNKLGRIIYSLISRYQAVKESQNIINIKLSDPNLPLNLVLRKLENDTNDTYVTTDTYDTTHIYDNISLINNATSIIIPTTIPTTIPQPILTTIPDGIMTTIPFPKTTYPKDEYSISNINETNTNHKNETNNDKNSSFEQESTKENEYSNNNNENNENFCKIDEILNNTCNEGKMNLSNLEEIKNIFKEQIKEVMKGDENSNLKKIKTGNVIIQYGSLDEQKNSNDKEASSIDLGDCEKILKDINGISQNKSLVVYKVDVKTSDLSSTYVQYEVYNPDTMIQLNLSVCEKITIKTPVDIGTEMEDIYNSLSESGYNLFDGEDSFYQDICTTYTTPNGTDILLSDRKKDIYSSTSNVTLCQTGCKLYSYNPNSKKASCNCDTSTAQTSLSNINIDTLFDKEEIKDSFYETLSNSNFRVLKCYKIVFSSKFWNNVGGIFTALIGFAFLGFHILSYVLYKSMISSYIMKVINLNDENIAPNSEGKPEVVNIQKDDKTNINEKKEENKEEIIEENKEENIVENIVENITRGKRGKKKKKTKKKKSAEEAQFPPKKNKRKNKIIEESKVGVESSKNNMANDVAKNFNDVTDNKNDILIFPNAKTIDNNNDKIKEEKNINIITSKEGLDNNSNEKGETALETVLDITKLNDQEINTLKYEDALKIDKRTYFEYYWSLLKKKHLILFTFYPANDYNLFAIKVSLFLLSFGLYFTMNGFFFSDDTMHKLYEDKGKYNIIYRIPQILFSTIISAVINVLLKMLSLTEASILSIKQEKDKKKMFEKSKSINRCLKFKFFIYFFLSIIFMVFFWYFIACFCGVYTNTQIVLIKDTLVSYALSMVYPFGLNLLPGFFRIPALKAEKGDKGCLYKISLIVALI